MNKSALTVTAPEGQTKVLVMDRDEAFPTTFALMATNVSDKVALRISGGCKGMGDQDKAEMRVFFEKALAGYGGMIWSGGTRAFKPGGSLDPMVTDVPGWIAANNPGCVALGSVPRTDVMRLQGESRLVLDQWGTGLNPSMAGVLIVQKGADGQSDWDGDLDAAFELMGNLKSFGGFEQVGLIAWNGGGITQDEIMRSAKAGWPTFVIEGSGRVADQMAAQLKSGDPALLDQLPKSHRLRAVSKDDPSGFRLLLSESGFIAR